MKVARILSSPLGSVILSDVSVFRDKDEKNSSQGQEASNNNSPNKDNLISTIKKNNSFNVNSLLASAPRSSCFSKTAESLLQYSPESVGMTNTKAGT